jgi:predicted site-specific integrase-resolvase
MASLEVKKALLRRGEVKKALGISEQEMSHMVKEGLIKAHYYRQGARAYYLKSQIEKLLTQWEAQEVAA